MSGWHNQVSGYYPSVQQTPQTSQRNQQTGFGTLQNVEKPKVKLGLPMNDRQLPPLQFKSMLKELPMPPANANYQYAGYEQRINHVKQDMKQQMDWMRQSRLDPTYIERR